MRAHLVEKAQTAEHILACHPNFRGIGNTGTLGLRDFPFGCNEGAAAEDKRFAVDQAAYPAARQGLVSLDRQFRHPAGQGHTANGAGEGM